MSKRGRPPKLDSNGQRVVTEKTPPEYKAVYWVEDPDDETFKLPDVSEIKIMFANKEKEYEEGQRAKVLASRNGGLEGSKSGRFGRNIQDYKVEILAYLAMRGEEILSLLENRLEENKKKLAQYYEELEKI